MSENRLIIIELKGKKIEEENITSARKLPRDFQSRKFS